MQSLAIGRMRGSGKRRMARSRAERRAVITPPAQGLRRSQQSSNVVPFREIGSWPNSKFQRVINCLRLGSMNSSFLSKSDSERTNDETDKL